MRMASVASNLDATIPTLIVFYRLDTRHGVT